MVCVISVRLIFVKLNDDGLLTANGLDKIDSVHVRKRTGSYGCTEYIAWELENYLVLVIETARYYLQRKKDQVISRVTQECFT